MASKVILPVVASKRAVRPTVIKIVADANIQKRIAAEGEESAGKRMWIKLIARTI